MHGPVVLSYDGADEMQAIHDLGAVLGIWAHPDDETYLAGGVMAVAVEHGQRVACVTATPGERGTDDPVTWPPDRLAAHRTAELDRALELLGVDAHWWLGLRDGQCAEVPDREVVPRLAEIVADVRPDTVLTFAPDGMTGHPDHVAVGRWAVAAVAATGSPCRVLGAAKDPGWVARFADLHRQVPVFGPGTPVAVARSRMALHVEFDGPTLDRKVAALRAQDSQTDPLVRAFGPHRWREWVRTEAFVALDGTADDTNQPMRRRT